MLAVQAWKKGVNTLVTQELVNQFATMILNSIRENDFSIFLDYKIAIWDILREGECISDMIWKKTYKISQPNEERFEKNAERLFASLTEYDKFWARKNMKDESFKYRVLRWMESLPVDEDISVACHIALREFFPLELVRNLWVEYSDLWKVAFSILEVEKLIKEKKIHKHLEDSDIWRAPSCVFFVQRIDMKFYMLRVGYSDSKRSWYYVAHPMPYQLGMWNCESIPKNAKIFLKIA
jgi:hypothetical protein